MVSCRLCPAEGSSFGVASWRNRGSSVRGVLMPGPPDGVPHVGGVLRTPGAEHLEVDILLESLEQPLPAAQHERRGGDRELVDHARHETLADQVGTTTEGDPAVTGELARLQQRGVEAVNEQEARTRIGLVLGAVGQHNQRAGEWIGAAPGARGVVHVAADDPAAKPVGDRLVVLPVRAVHAVGVVAVVAVGPRATHHPVMEALAPDAEAVLRPVLRPHDVAVDRGRDGCDDLAHGSSFVRVRQIRPSHTPRIIGGAHHPRAHALTNGNSRSAARSARTCRIPHGCTALPTPPVAHSVKISYLAARPASGAPGPMTGRPTAHQREAVPEYGAAGAVAGWCYGSAAVHQLRPSTWPSGNSHAWC